MWTYKHSIGVIHVESWGKPFLVVTENKYWRGKSWGYTYYKLGVTFDNINEAHFEVDKLNTELKCKDVIYNSDESQNFLLGLQEKFIYAEIKKILV